MLYIKMTQLIMNENIIHETQIKKRVKKQWKKPEISKLLRKNGYALLNKGRGSHELWRNDCGKIISIPQSYNYLIMARLIKENNLKEV